MVHQENVKYEYLIEQTITPFEDILHGRVMFFPNRNKNANTEGIVYIAFPR